MFTYVDSSVSQMWPNHTQTVLMKQIEFFSHVSSMALGMTMSAVPSIYHFMKYFINYNMDLNEIWYKYS